VLESTVTLADAIGIDALTIRKLATAMGTKPMSIYRHVPSKDEIVDGMADRVFAEIERPSTPTPTQTSPGSPSSTCDTFEVGLDVPLAAVSDFAGDT
jgi:AcrR family transcriptional regulator